MKKIYATLLALLTAGALINASAQQQANNADFESWDSNGEPTNWNNMTTGNLCTLCAFGSSLRVFQDNTEYHGGAASARIETTSAIGNVVNGAITTGKVNAPSTTPSQGYNATVMADADFNHPFTDMPDSVVVWAKYNVTDATDSARMSFVLHDSYDLHDPQDGNSAAHVVASARKNFQTGGVWERISVPFDYSGPSTNGIAYLLGTFTSSYTPGAGSTTAKLWVDDLEFIYNPTSPTGIVEELADVVSVYPNPTNDGRLTVSLGSEMGNGLVTVFNTVGQTVGMQNFMNTNLVDLQIDQPAGMYFVRIATENGQTTTVRVIKN
ncbi:MAG: T9SS type A sorting domain-containing protein [Flavobacteriales bacterium]|nr:T9SS type A sorting domain-containing protein [Flavobacteriales bacterium]